MSYYDRFGTRTEMPAFPQQFYYRLNKLAEDGIGQLDRLPISIKILLEAVLRHCDGYVVTEDHVRLLANWRGKQIPQNEIPFIPARVILQDFTGVPAVVDLAAMRSAMSRMGGDPKKINPLVPVDLVIDHSVQVDYFGSQFALVKNAQLEFERNRERYEFLKWGQKAFDNFKVVPPASGIVHQVNLEYLATVVMSDKNGDLYPDTLVGTDSHTTMINGLGVLGWGVGGIEAEAAMLGQPMYMLIPEVIGFKLTGKLPEGTTATDLVLVVTQMLRKKGVVSKFVEFYGEGMSQLSLADRATIANMAPEYGATIGLFPVDGETLAYMRRTGRSEELIQKVAAYTKAQGIFYDPTMPEPDFSDTLELDLGSVQPSLAGPMRPQDRVPLDEMQTTFQKALRVGVNERGFGLSEEALERKAIWRNGHEVEMGHGSVIIAAITSCTNTSNPSVMLAAGILAKKAVEKGLTVKPYVKTSLAPGSKVVTDYLEAAGLMSYLEQLGFHTVGYGCTTCIGNSGPLPETVSKAVKEGDIVAAAVLSGNRNFSGRIHAEVKANYLASPPLVVAYALAGTANINLTRDPIGNDPSGNPVYLQEIWPSREEVKTAVDSFVTAEMFHHEYGNIYDGNEMWNAIPTSEGELFNWQESSTYIQEPPFFVELNPHPAPISNIEGVRVLVNVGDSVTTDHISPAGSIAKNSPAAKYLISNGVEPLMFNSYGSRRGNDRVMTRGTFANIRLRNLLAAGAEGGVTAYLPTGEIMPIYDASVKYKENGIPLMVIAGKDYGMGSSRDWAAKGTLLLGVKMVIAESYERIHRSNLVGMGVLPLQFKADETAQTLGLDGSETYRTLNLADDLKPLQTVTIVAQKTDGSAITFDTTCRIDTPVEVDYYRNGGILQTVLLNMLAN